MKTIHFITDRTRIADYLTTPVRAARAGLRERGYRTRFHYDVSEEALSCDVVALISKPVLRLVNETETLIGPGSATVRLLERARAAAGKVVWLDSSDSTGVTHFELLPYVDLYLKKHLLRDLSLYERPFYGGRIFSDFVHRHFGITDDDPFEQFCPLAEGQRKKVGLSWNMGLGELYHSFGPWGRFRRLLPELVPPRLGARFVDPASARPDDVFLRASTSWGRASVSFHRRELIRRLQTLLETSPGLSGMVTRRNGDTQLSLREYRDRMANAKLAFGPFGWGELNLREYEALISGCLLLRPDLSHMDTWPDLFRDGDTCVYYRWDFADLEEKIEYYLTKPAERVAIAAAGQAAYRDSISAAGMERFAEWFTQQIEK